MAARAVTRALPTIRPATRIAALVTTVAGIGFAALAVSLSTGEFGPLHTLLVLVGLIVLSEAKSDLYFDGRLSISFMGVVIAAIALGPAAAAITATTVAVTGYTMHARDFKKFIFNVGQHNIAALAASAVVISTPVADHLDSPLVALAAGAGTSVILYAVAATAVSLAIALSSNQRPFAVFRELFQWMFPHYAALGAMAGGISLVYANVGTIAILLLVAPLALSWYSIRQVVEKTRNTLERLEESNSQLRSANAANSAILEAIPDVMYQLDPRGVIVEANAPGAAPPPLLRGIHFADGFPAAVARRIRSEIATAHRTGFVRLLEYQDEGADGRPQHFEARIVPVKGGDSLLMVRDISDRKNAEQARQLAEEFRRTATSSAPVILFAVGAQGTIELVEGQALERLPGAAGAIGRPAWDLFDNAGEIRTAMNAARSSREPVTTNGEAGGRIFELHISRTGGESSRGLIGVAVDVTERRRVQEAMVETQKLESLGVLAGGIAHDFNNLLVGILGNADLALTELDEHSAARATVQDISLAGRRAADLARQMLAYAGKGRLEVQQLDFGKLVAETSGLLRSTVHKGVTIEIDAPENESFVEADATQLRQVVMNLVVNGSDAIGSNGGRVRVSLRNEKVSAAAITGAYAAPDLKPGEFIALRVTDSGCGMDTETMARIFDPFFTTKFTGHGLGLAAVLGIIRSHHGAIRVESEPGRGTTFTVLLPALKLQSRPRDIASEKPGEWKGKGTILVVDDDQTVRKLTRKAVSLFGFDVIEAVDGVDGVERYAEHAADIRAVIIDMTMPRLSGDEALARIREIRPDAKVILMSGYASEEASERIGASPDAFIQKPFTLDVLKDTIRDVLDGPEARAAA
ncbi:MAG: PAS domain-containing protein [Dehalococcoidia bacterium]|nr:PAS domain-containing protein [Dehalococcoidia bacterium]MCA9853350.1 PAS domain-containing protein [Dehalococcoidia bacterium]